ncbi:hypothetical protein FN846DRAFT_893095 [Sphaerosporella brunnea]|uniref:Uncharacterized protein n=1 Tax=Sphaerosporella brunnea TaxID=1250544 RepID=A0A5J5ENI3_9PEZI|nr:hypothetical protein FN846DRAFT_893095 [Sphaerosporella brunnea]
MAHAIPQANQGPVRFRQLPLSDPTNFIYLPGDTQHPGYIPRPDQNFSTVCPLCHHVFRGGPQGLTQLRQHLSQSVPEFLARLPGGPTIALCVNSLDAQNLIRLILHCDSSFRAPNNVPTGAVSMVALNTVPRFWWRLFGLQWREVGPMFAVRLRTDSQPYPPRPGTVAQWMAAVESIWRADRRGFFGVEMLPGVNHIQGAHLVVVIPRYVQGGNAAGSAKTSVNFTFSREIDDTRLRWAAMEASVGQPVVVTVLPGDRDFWMAPLPQTIEAANLHLWWATSRGTAIMPVRGTIP